MSQMTRTSVASTTARDAEPAIERRPPALHLDFEWGPDEASRRIKAIAAGLGVTPPAMAYRRCAGLLADQIEEIRTKNAESGAGLLIVDSAGMACGTTGDGDPAGPFALGRQDPLWGRRMIRASEG